MGKRWERDNNVGRNGDSYKNASKSKFAVGEVRRDRHG